MSSLAVKAAYLELVPQFEKSSGKRVDTDWVGMVDIRKRVGAGEALDAVIGSAALVDELIEAGKLARGSRVDLVKSGVGVAVRKGAPKPDIASLEALKKTLRAAQSIGYSAGPSGVYLEGLFKRLGIFDELKPRMTQAKPGVYVGELVARGEYELAFQQVPELMAVEGITFVGPLPAEVQTITVFSGGVHAAARDAEGARALFAFLKAREAHAVLRRKGLEPA